MADLFWRSTKKPGKSAGSQPAPESSKFKKYQNETADAWDAADDELVKGFGVDPDASRSAALAVLARYSKSPKSPTPAPEEAKKNSVERSNTSIPKPKLKIPPKEKASNSEESSNKPKSPIIVSPGPPNKSFTGLPPLTDAQIARSEKFSSAINRDLTDLADLRELAWRGCPPCYRPITWRLVTGLLPNARERRLTTLQKKRNEYWKLVDRYFKLAKEPSHKDTYHQITIDIPRTNPSVPLFQQKLIQELMERVLFIWAMRHPASGYVQGMNDLVTPFLHVFLSEHLRAGEKFETTNMDLVPQEALREVEADCFWCLGWLLDGIQDNYTFAQPGIQRQVSQLEDLIERIQPDLYQHLQENSVQFLQFAFRWFNNLLMRELPLTAIVRLWDSYFSEAGADERSSLHLFVCAAFLIHWKRLLLDQCDFQGLMMTVQGLPTNGWGESEISEILAKAFMLRSTYTLKQLS